MKYLIDKWNSDWKKKNPAHTQWLNGCRSIYSHSPSPCVPATGQRHHCFADLWHFKMFWHRCSLTFLLRFTHFIHLSIIFILQVPKYMFKTTLFPTKYSICFQIWFVGNQYMRCDIIHHTAQNNKKWFSQLSWLGIQPQDLNTEDRECTSHLFLGLHFSINNALNVKGIALSDEPKENYHLTLQFPSSLWCILTSFSTILVAILVVWPVNVLFC